MIVKLYEERQTEILNAKEETNLLEFGDVVLADIGLYQSMEERR